APGNARQLVAADAGVVACALEAVAREVAGAAAEGRGVRDVERHVRRVDRLVEVDRAAARRGDDRLVLGLALAAADAEVRLVRDGVAAVPGVAVDDDGERSGRREARGRLHLQRAAGQVLAS